MMRMRQVPQLIISAKNYVELQPMGYHLMMFDLTSPLKDGERVTLTFTFKDKTTFDVTVPVKSIKKMK